MGLRMLCFSGEITILNQFAYNLLSLLFVLTYVMNIV